MSTAIIIAAASFYIVCTFVAWACCAVAGQADREISE